MSRVTMQERNKKIIVLLVLGLIVQQHSGIATIGNIISTAFSLFSAANEIHDTYLKFTTASTDDIMEKTEEIAQSINSVGNTLEGMKQSIDQLLNRLPLLNKIDSDVQLLNAYAGRVYSLYDELQEYIATPDLFEPREVKDLVDKFTSQSKGDVGDSLTSIFTLIIPNKLGTFKKSLFLLLAQEAQDEDLTLCDTGASPQARLLELFDIIVETETRASIMIGFGNLILSRMENETKTGKMKRNRLQFTKRSEGYLLTLKNALDIAPVQFRRCDPPRGYKRGVNFYEFERFVQIFMVQEGGLNRGHSCDQTCSWSQPSRMWPGCGGFECSGSLTTCYGTLASCWEQSGGATLCEYNPLETRRYAWIDHKSELWGDNRDGCPRGDYYHPYKPPDYRWFAEIRRGCSLCTCSCVEDSVRSPSSHFISLREQTSNLDNNMVVIGVAFVMIEKILHIKIMQGELGPGAKIRADSMSWMEPENIEFNHQKSKNADRAIFIKKSEDGNDEELVEDEDVAVLSLKKKRINLDKLSAPKNYVLTGVRFRRNMKEDSAPIELGIRMTVFDYGTGQLDPESSIWHFSDNPGNRTRHGEKKRKNPAESTATVVDLVRNGFMDVDMSGLIEDAGQTTVPLLDGVPLFSEATVPLSGVGLYHKKQDGYNGFLTFILEGLNHAPYLPSKL